MNKCLIVDDAIAARMATRRLAEKLRLRVREAENGHAAMRHCLRRMPDIILLDWSMPGMDGYTFLQVLRRMPSGDKPKVIFCTARHDAHAIHQAIAAGADEFIMKPFDSDILASKLIQVGVLISGVSPAQDGAFSTE